MLVIGDLILDHYIWGRVSRISPEAPVPVVHVDSESFRLGGAANVFNNILALGGKADLCGVIGSDESGRMLLKELGTSRSGRGGVVIDPDRPTTRKSRVIAHNQQIVRYDVERRGELKPAMQRKILRYVESRLRDLSCLVVSDYAKGVVSASLMADLTRLASLRGIPSSSIRKSNISAITKGRRSSRRTTWKRCKPPVCMATTIRPAMMPVRSSASG